MAAGPRRAQLHDPEQYWIPARYIHGDQVCDFCAFTIHAAAPGSRVGDRGTKAYFNSLLKVWECMGCRQEALRAASARLDEQQHGRRVA